MTKGSGSGKTPERVIELLKKAVAEKGQSAVARESGLTQSAVHRYLSGLGEPSTSTLQKLADFFEVTVTFLRGDSDFDIEGAQHNLYEILAAVSALSQKIGHHDELFQITAAASNLNKMLLPLINERDDKLASDIDDLKRIEDSLTSMIGDSDTKE